MRLATLASAVLAVLAVLASSGCADALYGTCADDSVCGAGTVCAFGLCVDANDARLDTVDVEIEPVESSGLPEQTVFDVDTRQSDGKRIELALVNGVRVSGTVKYQAVDEEGLVTSTTGVPATVQALPRRSIPGRLRVPTTTSDELGSFSFNLLRDAAYAMSIVPDGDRFPPLDIDDVDEDDFDDGASFVVAVEHGEVDADVNQTPFVNLHGRVVNLNGPQESIEVFVQSASGRRISTRVVTNDDGVFSLVLRSVPVGAQLVARPAQNVTAPRNPNLLQPTVVVAIDPATGDVDLRDILLGAVSGLSTSVSGVVTSSNGPAAGVTVTFQAFVGGGEFGARVVTGDDGSFLVDLIPGEYSVAAVPAATGRPGLLVEAEPLVVSPSTPINDLVIELPSRVDASVSVTSNDGGVVASASVTFERIGDVDGLAPPVLENAEPVFVAVADVEGNATVVVDRGRYRVKITPPRDSGAPAFSTLISVRGPFSRAFVLPPPNVLAGVVVDSGGSATPGAFVRVFSQLTDEQGRAIPLGEAICGADGSFAVSVPDLSP